VDHLALHTVRPEALFRQVKAFFENYRIFGRTRGVRVRFHVFVDDARKSAAFQDALACVEQLLHGQEEFQIQLYLGAALEARLPAGAPFFFDPSLGRVGGIRCIQNISEYVLAAGEVRPGDTVHRIDDDVFPLELRTTDDALVIEQAHDFFGEREALLARPEVRLVGSGLAGDSPSPVGDIFWSLRVVAQFFDAYATRRPRDDWAPLSRTICPNAADRVVDTLGLLDTTPLPLHASFAEVVVALSDLLENLERGRGRILLAPSLFYREGHWIAGPWIGPRYYTPNACVSHRAGEILTPAFLHGNPDIITYACESLWYEGGIWGAPPVLHLKALSARSSLFDLASTELKHDYRRTQAALVYLSETGLVGDQERQHLLHLVRYARRQLVEIDDYCVSIARHLLDRSRVPETASARIGSIVGEARSFSASLLATFDAPLEPGSIERLMGQYRNYCDDWKTTMSRVMPWSKEAT
jgi:hypothetical protein